MKDIFCRECKYNHGADETVKCGAEASFRKNWWSRWEDKKICSEKNRYNDCKDYEEIK